MDWTEELQWQVHLKLDPEAPGHTHHLLQLQALARCCPYVTGTTWKADGPPRVCTTWKADGPPRVWSNETSCL